VPAISMRPARPTLLTLTLLLLAACSASAQNNSLIITMAANEAYARAHQPLFTYISEERSTRTENHLWKEKVIETPDGILRRLLAVDGKPLTPAEQQTEQQRINNLVAHPDEFRRLNESRKDDEAHEVQMLAFLPKAFLFTPNGEHDGCTQFSFRPNPTYEPQTYEERVMHAMVGTVSLQQPMDRLCNLDAHMAQPVQFGFGLLGSVNSGHFGIERRPIDTGVWKTDRISVHLDGRILMLKSLSRNQDSVRTSIAEVSPQITLAQAAQLSAQ
jgi:hypothetical protein